MFSDFIKIVRQLGLVVHAYNPSIPAFGKLRQKDSKFTVSLGYIVRLCLKKKD
jgi:hypothetical protein